MLQFSIKVTHGHAVNCTNGLTIKILRFKLFRQRKVNTFIYVGVQKIVVDLAVIFALSL